MSAGTISKAFVDSWIFLYGPSWCLLTNKQPQFTHKCFQQVCCILDVGNLFTSIYHPQCNGQVEWFSRTPIKALRHYVADNLWECYLHTNILTCMYNTKIHCAIGCTTFELIPSPPMAINPTASDLQAIMETHYLHRWQRWLVQLLEQTDTGWRRMDGNKWKTLISNSDIQGRP